MQEPSESEKLAYTEAVFTKLLTDRMDRLTRGAVLRHQMHDTIARGEKPTGYRPQWIRDQSLELARMLQKMAVDFDTAHPDDKASEAELLDILATTTGLFNRE